MPLLVEILIVSSLSFSQKLLCNFSPIGNVDPGFGFEPQFSSRLGGGWSARSTSFIIPASPEADGESSVGILSCCWGTGNCSGPSGSSPYTLGKAVYSRRLPGIPELAQYEHFR